MKVWRRGEGVGVAGPYGAIFLPLSHDGVMIGGRQRRERKL